MYTLKSLLETHPIVIPMIQRDYAQGRTSLHATRVRTAILPKLKQATLEEEQLDFDFIYGSLKDETSTLHPLDGQQRLTTLYLLYWYIGHRKGNIPDYLKRFTYETRISARDFFKALCNEQIVETNDKISQMIQHQKWFRPAWLQDPTIKGSLIMLDALEKTFNDVEVDKLPDLNHQEPNIQFQFLDLDAYALDETLYIKMNSRGKPLSPFEHFKAQFEQMLVGNGWKSLAKQFSLRIEKEWTDLFWPFRDATTNTIDEVFLNYYRFVTGSIAFLHRSLPISEKQALYIESLTLPESFRMIYDTEAKVNLLFAALDMWTSDIHLKDTFAQYCQQIPLLSDSIGDRLLQGTITNEEQLLVYAILRLEQSNFPIEHRIRRAYVLRNIIEGIRQGNQGIYNSNLRFSMFEDLYEDIDQFVSAPDIQEGLENLTSSSIARYVIVHEKEKQVYRDQHPHHSDSLTRLETHPVLSGMTYRVFPSFTTYGESFVQIFEDLQSASQSLVTRALLACGEYDLTIGHSNLGNRRLFGGEKYTPFIWSYQIGNAQREEMIQVQLVFDRFFDRLMKNSVSHPISENLRLLIQEYLETSSSNMDWRYYFVASEHILTDKGAIFAMEAPELFIIERLRGVNLQSEHINPFYLDLVREANLSNEALQVTYYNLLSSIMVRQGTTLRLTKSGWKIYSDQLNDDQKTTILNTSSHSNPLIQGSHLLQIL